MAKRVSAKEDLVLPRDISRQVTDIVIDGDRLDNPARTQHIVTRLMDLTASSISERLN